MALCGLRAPSTSLSQEGLPMSRGACLGGYDESTESPSGFLIFPTVAITSRSHRQTPPVLRRDPSHGLVLDRDPSQ